MSQLILFVLGVVGGLALIAVSVAIPGTLLARPDDAADHAYDSDSDDDDNVGADGDPAHGHHQDGPHA